MVGKRKKPQTLNFFLVLTCLSNRSCNQTLPLERPPKLGLVTIHLLHLWGCCFTDVFNFLNLAVDSLERSQVFPLLPPVVSGAEISTSVRACTWSFTTPVFLGHFKSCYSATTVSFIYLFIYLFILFPMNRSITWQIISERPSVNADVKNSQGVIPLIIIIM